jgi:predicted lipoprotein with Yx(FWY)xxD motif
MPPAALALVAAALLFVAGCGGAEEAPAPAAAEATATPEPGAEPEPGAGAQSEPTAEPEPGAEAGAEPEPRPGTRIVAGDSEFGRMLFDADRQAIYIFELDPAGKTVCYDECAEAWPPVYAKGEPRAGRGIDASLLGTIRRRDGRRQVTYAGQPLYYYAHEAPGEVRCHNVNLNGGLWWVVGPDGKRRP